MTKLGAGVDELQLDVLQCLALGVDEERLSQSQDPLLGTNATTLDHDEILLHLSVVRESTHGVDGLVSKIILGRSIVLDQFSLLLVESFTHVIDLLVDLGTMMVSLLSSPGDSELDTRRMPGSNTSDLTKTLVRLPGQLLRVPTRSNTLESLSLGDADAIDHLVLGKDLLDGDLLLEVFAGEIDLGSNGAAVKLDLHDVRLLLTTTKQLLLSVANHTHNGAVLPDLIEVLFNLLLAEVILPFLARLGESLLLGLRPIFVESPLALLANMGSPDGLQSSETSWCVDVSNNTDANHGWSLNDGNSFNHLLLVGLGTGTIDLSDNVGHASLVAKEAGQVNGL
jgi:hypothetical protein